MVPTALCLFQQTKPSFTYTCTDSAIFTEKNPSNHGRIYGRITNLALNLSDRIAALLKWNVIYVYNTNAIKTFPSQNPSFLLFFHYLDCLLRSVCYLSPACLTDTCEIDLEDVSRRRRRYVRNCLHLLINQFNHINFVAVL